MPGQTRKVLARAPDGACYVMDRERLSQLRGYVVVEDVPDEPTPSPKAAGGNLASLGGGSGEATAPPSQYTPETGSRSGRRTRGSEEGE